MKTHELTLQPPAQMPWLLYLVSGLMLVFMTWLLLWA